MKHRVFIWIYALISVTLTIWPYQDILAQSNISFRDKHGNLNYAELDPRTGSVHRIIGLAVTVGDYGLTTSTLNGPAIDEMTTKLLEDYYPALKLSRSDLTLQKIDSNGKWWFAQYRQSVNGIPVYGTEIGFTIDPQGKVVTLGSSIYPQIGISTNPALTADEATETAIQKFADDSSSVVGKPELTIFPVDDSTTSTTFGYHLSWKVELVSMSAFKHFIYLIDAQDGTILRELNNVRDYNFYGTITGSYWPVRASDQTVSSAFVTTNVAIFNSAGQEVTATNTNSNGYYSMYVDAFQYYYVHIPLQNSWIKVRDYSNGDDIVTHIVGTVPSEVDYAWSASDGSNVRRHADDIHTYYSETIGYSGMNYQMTGRINLGSSVNGGSDGTNIGFGSEYGEPWAHSSDVIYHEYCPSSKCFGLFGS